VTAPVVLLILASGAAWESSALGRLDVDPGVVVLRRCVDVADLVAAASAGQADVAVVAIDSPGLDFAAVDHLRRSQVRVLSVVAAASADEQGRRSSRLGIQASISDDQIADLAAAVRETEVAPVPEAGPGAPEPAPPAGVRGYVIAVWGPAGAPGRTTLAVALAAELAARGRRTTLVDADPYGGAVAQQLGVLDEVSGLLAAARLSGSGLMESRFASVQRAMGEHLTVVTGLPRADRWAEVRPGAVDELLQVASSQGDVVVDTGFSLEADAAEPSARPSRNQATLAAIGQADEVVVVGSADPVGLARLVRGLAELGEVAHGAAVRVVVNRMRPSLGWSESDVRGLVEGILPLTGLHFLPDDRHAADLALVGGRTLVESADSPLRRAVAEVVDTIAPATAAAADGRRSRRRGARVRPRRAGRARRP
jgi:MinD-like ATPase involved in chromosome partitioning or flagellar assembly